jgi:hypothetical protein
MEFMSNAAGNIIEILANLPEFLRKPMLKNRLEEFYGMNEDDRRETISMAISAAPSVEPNKLSVLFRTWLEVMSDFDAEKRTIMFKIYCRQILANARLIERLDFKSLTATFASLDKKQRDRLTDSLQEVLFSFPNRNEIIKLLPEESLKAIGLK